MTSLERRREVDCLSGRYCFKSPDFLTIEETLASGCLPADESRWPARRRSRSIRANVFRRSVSKLGV